MIAGKSCLGQPEIMVVIQNIEVLDDLFVGNGRAAEGYGLVKKREGIPHGPIGFLGQNVQGILFDLYGFLMGDLLEVADNVRNGDPVEVVGLATR